MKKHFEEIDILKGIAIVMVLLGHAVIRFPVNLHDVAWTNAIYNWVETTHMPLFFLVSGFCFSYRGKYSEYIMKKIKRILIPFLFFNLIDSVPRQLLSFLVNRPKSIKESIASIVLYGGEYWFLYSLFVIFLFFPLFSEIIKKYQFAQVIAIVICVSLKFMTFLPGIFLIRRTTFHLLFFVSGYILKQYFNIEKASSFIESKKDISIGGIFLLFSVWVLLIPCYLNHHTPLIGIPLSCIGITWSYLMTVIFIKGRVRKLFVGFGKYSLQLYLLNGFTLVFARTLVIKVMHCNVPFIILMFNMLATLFGSYLLIKYMLSRFKSTRFICGIV